MDRSFNNEKLKLFEFLTNSAQDSIFTKNLNREYSYVNPAMAKLFNCLPEDLIGKKPEDLFSENDSKIVTEVDDKTFRGEHVSEQKKLLIDKKEKMFHTIQSPLYDNDNNIIGICGIVREVTEFYYLQERLIQSEKLSAVGHLAAGIAHEFNNILAITSLNVKVPLLAYESGSIELPDSVVKNLNNIHQIVHRGKTIISNLMSFARPRKPFKDYYRIESILEEVLKVQEYQLEMEHIKIHRFYNETQPLYLDKGQFEQVFLNLIINARHAILPKGKGDITFSTQIEEGDVKIMITDNGIGIDKESQKDVFTPFYTTKGAMAKDNLGIKGTGLGLSISYTIVQHHNGSIGVESEEENGTTFTIKLPIVKTEVTADQIKNS